MELTVRKAASAEERFKTERLIATSFLHPWDEKEAGAHARSPEGDVWAAFDERGEPVSAVTTVRHRMAFEGGEISCGELHMVGTLPESRGSGAVRMLMDAILREYLAAGDLFAVLIPFSFAFYRKYGFENASQMLVQKADIAQFAPFRQEMAAVQILSQADTDRARHLYEAYALRYNLADLKNDAAWTWHDGDGFGERDWQYGDRDRYSYLFTDRGGKPRAYFTFVFVPGPNGPFTGTMEITELVYDSPEALRSVFAFLYGMRAKVTHVRVSLPPDADLGVLLPECDRVERTLDSHFAARALNIGGILGALRCPVETGRFSIRVTDAFLPENTGTYTAKIRCGRVAGVEKSSAPADLEVTVETFCQMAVGRIGIEEALYREGTGLCGDRTLLDRIFVKKPLLLS